jgi:hypothetical protein
MQTPHHMARMLPVSLHVIGVDPGPVPGFVMLDYTDGLLTGKDVVQCSAQVAPLIFGEIVRDLAGEFPIVGLERFVVRGRSGRSSTSKAGEQTRDLIGRLVQVTAGLVPDKNWHARAAGEVKPWATEERLEAAGLLDLTKGMRHARDAARHALFTAVRDGGVPDPLSKHALEVVGA